MRSKELARIAQEDPDQYKAIRDKERLKGMADNDVVELFIREGFSCEMTPRQQNIYQRWLMAGDMFQNNERFVDIQKALQDSFGVSAAHAAVDIRNATRLLGEMSGITKEAHRARAIDMALKIWKRCEERADIEGLLKAAKMYYLAAGLDQDTVDLPNIQKMMEQQLHAVVLDETTRSIFDRLLQQSGGVIDLGTLYQKIATDVEHEDVTTAK